MIKDVRRTSSAAPMRNATRFHSASSTVRFSSFRSDGMVKVKLVGVGVGVEDTKASLLLTQVHVQCGEGRRYTQTSCCDRRLFGVLSDGGWWSRRYPEATAWTSN